jgi:hypothetical protein
MFILMQNDSYRTHKRGHILDDGIPGRKLDSIWKIRSPELVCLKIHHHFSFRKNWTLPSITANSVYSSLPCISFLSPSFFFISHIASNPYLRVQHNLFHPFFYTFYVLSFVFLYFSITKSLIFFSFNVHSCSFSSQHAVSAYFLYFEK